MMQKFPLVCETEIIYNKQMYYEITKTMTKNGGKQ